jgi:tetratricopeptide (TPR) repeat protein
MLRVGCILIGMLAAWSGHASAGSNDFCAAGVAEFTAACQAWDGARFRAAAELFRRATTNEPANATNFYWLGTAQFHRLLQLQTAPGSRTNEAAAKAALDAAVAALTRAVKLDANHAESHALLGTLYGMKIDGNLFRALRFGPRVAKHKELALKHGAANARVQYLLGTCQFHTAAKPAAWREALATLLQAEKLFETEAKTVAGPVEPRWGYDNCQTFIGRAYEALGQKPEAAEYYRKALTIRPQNAMANAGLKRVRDKK